MEIILKNFEPEGLEVKASGKIDIDTAVEYGTKITDAIDDCEVKELVLDFSEITYISSMGLRVILELHQKMKDDGKMTIKNVNEQVLNILNMTGFTKFLNIV